MSTQAKRTVADVIKAQKKSFGGGWYHFSREIRQAIVSEYVFAIACNQDESIDPARVVAVMREMRAEVIRQINTSKGEAP